MRPTRLLAAAASAAALLLTPAAAQAQIGWTPCPDEGFSAFECATSPQPLDHANPASAKVNLFVRRLKPEGQAAPSATAVVALAGGPGQAAAPLAAEFATELAPGLKTRDLLVFDQRGTGRSGRLECDALEGRGSTVRVVGACANELGARRGFYRTADTVEDIEALRLQAGYRQLTFYGVSYGTKVAQDYAARYPQNVERLILDSVVPPEGQDTLEKSSFRAVSRVLNELCSGNRCRGATPDAVADIRTLVRRGKAIRGTYIDSRGRRARGTLYPEDLYIMLRAGDLNPAWRALMPGAVRAAVRGDERPLLQLGVETFGAPSGSQTPDDGDTTTLYLATTCEEAPFPWQRTSPLNARRAELDQRIRTEQPAAFAPFNRATIKASTTFALCIGWPNASPAPAAPPATLPQIPTLILNGTGDIRTPVEDAAAVAARIPGATLVQVPFVGHSVVGSDPSGCAGAAIAGFFNGQGVTPCPDARPLVSPLVRPPLSFGSLRATVYQGRVGRTVTAVLGTYTDALTRGLGAQLSGETGRIGGLRGGTIQTSGSSVRLRGVTFVPGVTVSGTIKVQGSTTFTVRGSRAARGRVTLTDDGRITGTLGGRKIRLASSAQARAASAAGAAASAAALAQAMPPHPALVRAAASSATR